MPLVEFLDWEDPLEKEMATHSSILAWEVPWTEEPGRLQSMGSQRAGPGCVTEIAGQQPSGDSRGHSFLIWFSLPPSAPCLGSGSVDC